MSEGLPEIGAMDSGMANLSKRQKAAIVVRVLLAEGAQISLGELPEDLQEELARQMSEMRFVDRSTLACVVDEFLSEIEAIGLSFPEGLEGALAILDGTISAATASRLRRQAGLAFCNDPWGRIGDMETTRLVEVIARESIEVGAILLSKLKVPKAAEVLGRLQGDRARRIVYAVSLTGAASPDKVRKIGLALVQQLDAVPPAAFDSGPVERVGAILNQAQSATREDVLEGLDAEDAGFAAQVRKAIFTFANIPTRISPRDIPRIARDVPQASLATLLAGARGADQTAIEFVLANMTKRLADTLRDEAAALTVKDKDVEEAASAVVARIREMEAEGAIFFTAEEDE